MNIHIGVVWYKNSTTERSLWLKSAVNAISLAPSTVGFTILEADNSEEVYNSPESRKQISEKTFSILLSGAGNIGFGAAHNKLMERSFSEEADFYLGVNPDGRFHRLSLSHLIPKIAAQPKHLYEMRQFPTEHPKHYAPDTGETLWASGAAFCLSRESWQTIGGFDDSFFMYCEDVDLSWRFRLAGRKCITISDSLYYHNTANRKTTETIEQRFLLSGLTLGRKYGISDLVTRCENALKQKGVPIPTPTIKHAMSEEDQHKFREQIYYKGDFSFSPIRWSL